MSIRQHPERNIVLIGLPKSGKSTTGREVAQLLRRPFIDMELELKRRRLMSLDGVLGISRGGANKDAETRIIRDLISRRSSVIALAPETPFRCREYDELRFYSFVVFLDPPFETLWKRLSPGLAAEETNPNGKQGTFEHWRASHARYESCNLQLSDASKPVKFQARLITHCFFT